MKPTIFPENAFENDPIFGEIKMFPKIEIPKAGKNIRNLDFGTNPKKKTFSSIAADFYRKKCF